ncbi:MAG TPA: SDR family NAD(P)-dependent oxidoreductase [Steroidobacteraceae bacterium]|nr:SDR family NAD(P)-dependent oxidoreductase [Steroidobacteraceae bacterium]
MSSILTARPLAATLLVGVAKYNDRQSGRDGPVRETPVEDISGKVAFITGGASGVGFGQARAFSAAGAKVVIADVRQDHLDQALAWFGERNAPVHAIRLDITDRAACARAADETERVFGPVQLLFNTAGVSIFGPLEKSTYADYDWMMGVNFGGVVNGIQTFVPRMIAHGQGGHIVNTASMGAFIAGGPAGIYCASKFAVRGLSEALRNELAKFDIGVSVLCPANVNTNIAESIVTRPSQFKDSGYRVDAQVIESLKTLYAAGMDPLELAGHVLTGVRKNQLYIIPYPEVRASLTAHFDAVLAALPAEDSDAEGVAKRRAAMAKWVQERQAQFSAR